MMLVLVDDVSKKEKEISLAQQQTAVVALLKLEQIVVIGKTIGMISLL